MPQNQLIKEKSTNSIFLIGFMGCGKTTIGKLLAEQLNYQFIDSDEEIEKETKLTISAIFNEFGESHFRKLEDDLIQNLINCKNSVISTGGGMPCFNNQIEKLLEIGTVVFINTSFENLIERIHSTNRPLVSNLKNDERIHFLEQLVEIRKPIYERADIIVNGNQSTEAIINEILAKCQHI